jgi:hypothetical protein
VQSSRDICGWQLSLNQLHMCSSERLTSLYPRIEIVQVVVGMQLVVALTWLAVYDYRRPSSEITANGNSRLPRLSGNEPTDSRGVFKSESHMHVTASGAVECARDIDLVIGVLASPSPRSTAARQTIRDTWARFPTPGRRSTLRFLLALDVNEQVPPHLLVEADDKGDLLFLHTLDKYENLARKVELFFKWAIDACEGAIHIFKTDDDSFVRLDELAKELSLQPTERLLYVDLGTTSGMRGHVCTCAMLLMPLLFFRWCGRYHAC